MIIKSMPGKEPSFAKLIAYIDRKVTDRTYTMHHNLLARNQEDVVSEFIENAKLLPKRKNGNVLYHEVVSITRTEGLSDAHQKAALCDIASHYISARAPHNLVYCALHDDNPKNFHVHVIVSANRLGEQRRHYLSKAAFRKITIEQEKRALAKYPELMQEVSINRKSATGLSKGGREVKRRLGKLPKRDALAADLSGAFRSVQTRDDLRAALQKRSLSFYRRGKHIGVIDGDTGRKHRLETLGLTDDFEAMRVRLGGTRQADQSLTEVIERIEATAATQKTTQTNDNHTNQPRKPEETDMELFSNILTVIGATADAMSITGTVNADDDKKNTQSEKSVQTEPSDTTKPQQKTDREIIAEARRAEMENMRKAYNLGNSQSQSHSRRR